MTAAALAARDSRTSAVVGEVLRDIARGGMAGALTGIVVGGLGGRIVMRLAAIAVPSSSGQFTENGNLIGHVTLSGSIALILFGGLFFGLYGGTLWVVVSPWIPGTGLRRAILTMPIAVALAGIVLIHGDNPDFRVLRHDGLVVAMLLALVAVAGLTIALLDDWLNGRLPRKSGPSSSLYLVLTLAGALLILPLVVQAYLTVDALLAFALVGVGLATLASWTLRLRGCERPPMLIVAGRAALVAAVVFGSLKLAPEVAAALGTA
jgi:hypothetical protein